MFNDELVEKVIEQHNSLLDKFVEYLKKKGLKPKTINKHLSIFLFF